jgi:ornithine--oxo-acid transaminase
MNTGAEAVETAMKICRKWGYLRKAIPENEAIILACEGNFHGRTIGVISMSTDPECKKDFGPFLPNVGPLCTPSSKEHFKKKMHCGTTICRI